MAKTTDNRSSDSDIDSSASDSGIANDSNGIAIDTEYGNSGCGIAIEKQQQSDEERERIESGTVDNPADPTAGTGSVRKRRVSNGRANGSSGASSGVSSPRQSKNKLDLNKAGQNTLALQVKGVHEIAGLLTGLGELTHITNEEAESLTQAVLDVMNQYKIKPNPKVVAWCNLAGIAGVIYAPRVWMILELRKQNMANRPQVETARPQTDAGNNVHKMNF